MKAESECAENGIELQEAKGQFMSIPLVGSRAKEYWRNTRTAGTSFQFSNDKLSKKKEMKKVT
jgi:hypothetical protein